ncbi:unnamed protein product [Taenia asiatica]|uniref:Prostatic spermine-binding protein-like n=1 Tax=Taenia asiatica TaxID=60517 RepID=A0A0R3VXQ0_TAEAS|nr:unnamed protein product [Taenia asiatica]
MASYAVLILTTLLTLAFRNAESRSIVIIKGKTDNGRKLFSNASTAHVKSEEVGVMIKPRNISIITLKDIKKEGEELEKGDLSDPISGFVIESANRTVRPRHQEEEEEFNKEGDDTVGEVEEDSSDVSNDEKDTKLRRIFWTLQHCGSNHGRRNGCDDADDDGSGFEECECANEYYGPNGKSAFYEDEEGVGATDKEVEADIDFDDIEDDEDDAHVVDEDQEDMEDLEGTVVKANNSSDNADGNDETKRGNGNDEDAGDGDDGGEDYK